MFPSKLWWEVQNEQLEVTFPTISKSFNEEIFISCAQFFSIVCIIFCFNFCRFYMFPSKLWWKVQNEQLEVTFPAVSKSFNEEIFISCAQFFPIVCTIFCFNFCRFYMFPSKLWSKVQNEQLEVTFPTN